MLRYIVHRYVSVLQIYLVIDVLIRLAEVRNGFGRHIYVFGPVDAIERGKIVLKGLFVFEIFFHTATTFSKLSV